MKSIKKQIEEIFNARSEYDLPGLNEDFDKIKKAILILAQQIDILHEFKKDA